MIAMGKKQDNQLAKEPLIAELYRDYLVCRSTQLTIFRKPTGKSDGSERLVTVLWPMGFSILPREGGLDDQSFITARLFTAFLHGEQRGISRSMAK
jgi:hypothetical protein